MKKVIFSGFADEAAVMLEYQMNVLEANGIKHIEMRGVNGKHVLEYTEKELEDIRKQLDARGFQVSAIGSPIGKSDITADFSNDKERFEKAIAACKILGCKYIRIFSFYIPKGEDPYDYKDEVINRLKELVSIAENNNVICALENDSGLFGNNLENCVYIFSNITSSNLQLAFDPGNFIHNDTVPYPDAYKTLKDKIAYFHIKDAAKGDSKFLPSDEGQGRIGEMLNDAYSDGFSNFLSIEPHLGYLNDLNKAQQFTVAVNALKSVFDTGIDKVDINTLTDSKYIG